MNLFFYRIKNLVNFCRKIRKRKRKNKIRQLEFEKGQGCQGRGENPSRGGNPKYPKNKRKKKSRLKPCGPRLFSTLQAAALLPLFGCCCCSAPFGLLCPAFLLPISALITARPATAPLLSSSALALPSSAFSSSSSVSSVQLGPLLAAACLLLPLLLQLAILLARHFSPFLRLTCLLLCSCFLFTCLLSLKLLLRLVALSAAAPAVENRTNRSWGLSDVHCISTCFHCCCSAAPPLPLFILDALNFSLSSFVAEGDIKIAHDLICCSSDCRKLCQIGAEDRSLLLLTAAATEGDAMSADYLVSCSSINRTLQSRWSCGFYRELIFHEQRWSY